MAQKQNLKPGSFKSAFAKNCRRSNMGSTFTWNGKKYNCSRESISFHEAHTFEGHSAKEKKEYWTGFKKFKKKEERRREEGIRKRKRGKVGMMDKK